MSSKQSDTGKLIAIKYRARSEEMIVSTEVSSDLLVNMQDVEDTSVDTIISSQDVHI